MHEKTGKEDLIDWILEHSSNKRRDDGELQNIRKKLVNLSFQELQAEYRRLQLSET